jgi:hypothetical protein
MGVRVEIKTCYPPNTADYHFRLCELAWWQTDTNKVKKKYNYDSSL